MKVNLVMMLFACRTIADAPVSNPIEEVQSESRNTSKTLIRPKPLLACFSPFPSSSSSKSFHSSELRFDCLCRRTRAREPFSLDFMDTPKKSIMAPLLRFQSKRRPAPTETQSTSPCGASQRFMPFLKKEDGLLEQCTTIAECSALVKAHWECP